MSLYEEYQYTQTISSPTRITETTSSLIDHVITNTPQHIIKSGVSHLGISDHSLIFTVRRLAQPRGLPRIVESRRFNNFNEEDFLEDMRKNPWDMMDIVDDPNEKLYIWQIMFLEVLDKHAPLRKKRVRNCEAPWLTPQLKQEMFCRNHLKKQAINSGLSTSWQAYRIAKNKVNYKLDKAKRDFYVSNLDQSKGNPKRTWKLINNLLNRKTKNTVVTNLKVNGDHYTDPTDILYRLDQN